MTRLGDRPKARVTGRIMGMMRKILAEAELMKICKNRVRAYTSRMATAGWRPSRREIMWCITVSMIPLSVMTSLGAEARAIMATAGSIAAMPLPICRQTSDLRSQTT